MLHDELTIDAAVICAMREHVDEAGEPLELHFALLDQALWLGRSRAQREQRMIWRRMAEIDARLAALAAMNRGGQR
jgi:hypothetical protein